MINYFLRAIAIESLFIFIFKLHLVVKLDNFNIRLHHCPNKKLIPCKIGSLNSNLLQVNLTYLNRILILCFQHYLYQLHKEFNSYIALIKQIKLDSAVAGVVADAILQQHQGLLLLKQKQPLAAAAPCWAASFAVESLLHLQNYSSCRGLLLLQQKQPLAASIKLQQQQEDASFAAEAAPYFHKIMSK